MDINAKLAEAEMTDNNGLPGRSVPTGTVFLPNGATKIVGDMLHWETDWEQCRHVKLPKRILGQFIRLHDRTDEEIRRFAAQWGPLSPINDADGIPRQKVSTSGDAEPLAAWRFFSRRARSIMGIAADLKQGRKAEERYWAALSTPTYPEPGPDAHFRPGTEPNKTPGFWGMPNWSRRELVITREGGRWGKQVDISREKGILSGEINSWLETFGLTLKMNWTQKANWHLEIDYRGRLSSALSLQLALVVADAKSIYICSGCHMPYVRQNQAPRGAARANYCDDCGPKEAQKNAEVRRLRDKREARRLHAEGLTVPCIAAQLGKKTITVRTWLKSAKAKRKTKR